MASWKHVAETVALRVPDCLLCATPAAEVSGETDSSLIQQGKKH